MAYTPGPSTVDNPIYKPLDKAQKEIRVLRTEPGTLNDPLVGVLHTTNLATEVGRFRYDAISYHWGDASITSRIVLHGLKLDVPASAVQTLSNLRDRWEPRYFWIDAICINQVDMDERGHQVRIMNAVYQCALVTHVWLGLEDENTHTEIQSLQAFVAALPAEVSTNAPFNFEKQYEEERKSMLQIRKESIEHLDPRPVMALLSRPYFCRIWVYQEVIISSTCTTHIGQTRFPWIWLERVVRFLYCRSPDLCGLDEEVGNLFERLCLPYSAGHVRAMRNAGYVTSLLSLVLATRDLQTTDPRDKIFGLLALTVLSGQEVLYRPVVDYRKSVEECFKDATREMIRCRRSLDCLDELIVEGERDSERRASLPSWTPEFELTHREIPMQRFPLEGSEAHGNTNVDMRDHVSYNDNSLVLGGFKFAKVSMVLPPFSAWPQHPLVEARMQPRPVLDEHMDLEAAEFLSRLLPVVLLAGEYNSKRLVDAGEALKDVIAMSEQVLLDDTSEYHSAGDAVGQANNAKKLKFSMGRCCKLRRLFWINDCFGIGPKSMCDTDIVVVLPGCKWPLVLRPTNVWYRFVGACYVIGISDGSFMQQKLDEGAEAEVFDIR